MEIIYSFIAASASMIGVVLVLSFHKWSEKNSFLIISFAAGVMLTLALMHLIPESLKINSKTMMYVLLGFLAMFFLQFVILFHPCHDDRVKHMGITSIIGLSLHSLTDGFIIAVGFGADTRTGILTTLAILLHKLPDGITDAITLSGILLHNGASKKKIFYFSLLTACFTPIGTFLGMFLFKNISMNVLSALLSATAGSFIFLSASEFIPETHKCKDRTAPLMLFAGVIVILIIEQIINL